MSDEYPSQYGTPARFLCAFIALIAVAAISFRVVIRMDELGGALPALSFLTQFFTILTNGLVCLAMILIVFGVQFGPRFLMAITISIVAVGIIYHVALSHLVEFTGLELLADHAVHTAVPTLTLLWWLAFAPKRSFSPSDIITWTAWPLMYCVYILFRASFSGFYPYPFLNLPELGVSGLVTSTAVLSLAFIVMGFGLLGLSRMVGTRERATG
ncbi:MAG: Pr6Pr family membrane protein [Pseudomonadota bacterium]